MLKILFFHKFYTRTHQRHRTVHLQLQSACLVGESGEDVDIRSSSSLARHDPSIVLWPCQFHLGSPSWNPRADVVSDTLFSVRWLNSLTAMAAPALTHSFPSDRVQTLIGVLCLHAKKVARTPASQNNQLHVSVASQHCPCVLPLPHLTTVRWKKHQLEAPAGQQSWSSSVDNAWRNEVNTAFLIPAKSSAIILLQWHDCVRCQLAVPFYTSDDTLSCHLPQCCAKSLRHN